MSAALAAYPRIGSLSHDDVLFRQFSDDVERGRKLTFRAGRSVRGDAVASEEWNEIAAHLLIYEYVTRKGDTLLSIASRASVPYDAIATLNRLSAPASLAEGQVLLLPTMNALFIPEKPASDMERLLASASRFPQGCPVISIGVPRTAAATDFLFVPGGEFTPTERLFFLHPLYRYPLRDYVLTSAFGKRVSPISGRLSNHAGLDLAARMGAAVFAARSGSVEKVASNPIYGNYIILRHEGGMTSLYGHLSAALVKEGETVAAGQTIGKVGSTGQSTGPHLHFELRENGAPRDPARYLPKNER